MAMPFPDFAALDPGYYSIPAPAFLLHCTASGGLNGAGQA
jgi:hypothetical protein